MVSLLWLALLAYTAHLLQTSRRATDSPSIDSVGRWSGWAGTALTLGAWLTLTVQLVRRGLASGHWPLANRYEFALCLTWAMAGCYLLLEASWERAGCDKPSAPARWCPRERRPAPFVLMMILLPATYAVAQPTAARQATPLLPALRSVWLQAHVLTALLGYALCGLAAALALARLLTPGRLPVQSVETAMLRLVDLAFPWLTLGILTGAIWAWRAWGRAWGWDPKESWALVVWLWHLLILHLRPLRRWRSQRMALLVVVGFGLILFTFAGLPWLVRAVHLESLHTF
jgi:ABC-type transport system involved in cytochrome c biogenesis permease subunit